MIKVYLNVAILEIDGSKKRGCGVKLTDLLNGLALYRLEGMKDVTVNGIEHDSRKVSTGDLFICMRGLTVDGHAFAEQAVQNGAVGLVVEERQNADVPQVVVPDSRRAMAVLASRFYGYPSERVRVIGVTGTNGKTTTTHLIDRILSTWGKTAGLIGTIETRVGARVWDARNTTPEALELQQYLHEMDRAGAEYAVMEVSSHALDMGRVRGCRFRTAVFTNLTQDHLDYHQTMANYREAKSLLFSQLGNNYAPGHEAYAVLNADDDASEYFKKRTAAQIVTYGVEREADVRAVNIDVDSGGTSFDVETPCGNVHLRLKLVGKFSVYNALAAFAASILEGVPLPTIKRGLEAVSGVNGRFERVDVGQDFTVLVDYAHTPDSLENVLKTIRGFAKGRILCVVGCGGDRDRGKRPLMARIATAYSDQSFFTSDNPRTEDPQAIIRDMLEGVAEADESSYTVIVDRRRAIERAISEAKNGDVVLIAGKGHETYQEINGHRIHFDDREVAREAIKIMERE